MEALAAPVQSAFRRSTPFAVPRRRSVTVSSISSSAENKARKLSSSSVTVGESLVKSVGGSQAVSPVVSRRRAFRTARAQAAATLSDGGSIPVSSAGPAKILGVELSQATRNCTGVTASASASLHHQHLAAGASAAGRREALLLLSAAPALLSALPALAIGSTPEAPGPLESGSSKGLVQRGEVDVEAEDQRQRQQQARQLEQQQGEAKRLLEQNRRIQRLNGAPEGFPTFFRQGFDVQVIAGPEYVTLPSGLVYWDIVVGTGDPPASGQQVEFHYTGYNESGRRIDSSYAQGRPSQARLGINSLIPGFEEGLAGMRVGGTRRIVVPPELGPPTGPSTFFSAKQYEVFDVSLLTIKTCARRQILFYSDVVCE